jgi:hypothetical protein
LYRVTIGGSSGSDNVDIDGTGSGRTVIAGVNRGSVEGVREINLNVMVKIKNQILGNAKAVILVTVPAFLSFSTPHPLYSSYPLYHRYLLSSKSSLFLWVYLLCLE